MALLGDNDVVVHRNAERARNFDDRLSHLDVGARGRRIFEVIKFSGIKRI